MKRNTRTRYAEPDVKETTQPSSSFKSCVCPSDPETLWLRGFVVLLLNLRERCNHVGTLVACHVSLRNDGADSVEIGLDVGITLLVQRDTLS